MKRRGLLIVATLTLLLTGVVLARAAASRRGDEGSVRGRHPFSGEIAIRYRQGQPTHWRSCLLQR
jgi:hypothetical protein